MSGPAINRRCREAVAAYLTAAPATTPAELFRLFGIPPWVARRLSVQYRAAAERAHAAAAARAGRAARKADAARRRANPARHGNATALTLAEKAEAQAAQSAAAALYAARDHDLTARLFGDPPPGRRALDQGARP